MKAGVILTGTGATLVLTSCDSFEDPEFVNALQAKSIAKYIACEIPIDLVRNEYGHGFARALHDTRETDVLRIVDVDGQRVFRRIPISAMSRPVCHEEPLISRRAA